MLVVAFDGVLFDTLPQRSAAIVDAFSAEGFAVGNELVHPVVAARTTAEAVRACARILVAQSRDIALDETTIDLVTLRAERTVSELTSRGAVLNVAMRERLRRAAIVTRIVVRADSRRRDVEPLLAMSELDSIISFVRCGDDGDRPTSHAFGSMVNTSMVDKSYADIARRMAGNMNLLGERSAIGIALEVSEWGRAAARVLGFDAPDTLSAATLPGAP